MPQGTAKIAIFNLFDEKGIFGTCTSQSDSFSANLAFKSFITEIKPALVSGRNRSFSSSSIIEVNLPGKE
jgi:hypothetical protein